MAVYIATDSAADAELIQRSDFITIPLKVSFGDEEFLDCVNLSKEDFYSKLEEYEELPVTSQITPFAFEEALQSYMDNGDQVILITLSSKLSGTWQNAALLANDYPEQLYVVDGLNASMGQRILIDYALRLKDEGKSVIDIVEGLENVKGKIHFVALLDTLENLKKGGRISKVAAAAGSLLSIKPIIAVEDGEVQVLGKARGAKQGCSLLTQEIQKFGEIDLSMPYHFGHTGVSALKVQKYMDENVDMWNHFDTNQDIITVGCAIGTHIGAGAIGVAWVEK